MRSRKNLNSLRDLLQTLGDDGRWEPEKREAFAKAAANLEHELKVGNKRSLFKAVNDLARMFVRSID